MTDSEFRALEGNPDLVLTKANRYAELANAITRSVTTLNAIKSTEGMTSKAIDKVREEAGNVADDIGKAQSRYAGTAAALITYSSQLRTAQDAADTAISHINSKETAADTASRSATRAATKAESSAPEDATTDSTAATKAEEAAETAGQELAAAHAEWHSALDLKNGAAQTAITAIVQVIEGKAGKELNDSWWDDWGAKALDILKTVCEIAGVLSIFLAWVPFLGPILLVLATIGAVISLVEASIKAMNGGSWGDVAFAAVGLVLTVFGGNIGKYLGKVVKAKGLTAAMTRPKSQFKALTGITKGQKGAQLKDVQAMLGSPKKLPNAMKEVFGTNPFQVKIKSPTEAFYQFRRNPFGVAGFDNPAFAGQIVDEIPMGSKVALGVWNYRVVTGKLETFTHNPLDTSDRPVSLKPESILKDLSHGELPKLTPG